VSRGRGDESDAEEGDEDDNDGKGTGAALPAAYRASDVAAYLADVAARTAASRANAKLAMTFPGGLRIAVKVRLGDGDVIAMGNQKGGCFTDFMLQQAWRTHCTAAGRWVTPPDDADTYPATQTLLPHHPFPLPFHQMYSLLRASEKPKRIKVMRDTYQETKASTAFLAPDGNLLR
jgi:hypothetical protein